MKEIKMRIQLLGKNYLCDENISKIFAEKEEERWRIKKENEGYIFRNIKDNTGIYGHWPTIHDLIISTFIAVSGFSIFFDEAA